MTGLALDRYRDEVGLDEAFRAPPPADPAAIPRLVTEVVEHLLAEGLGDAVPVAALDQEPEAAMDTLLTVRPAGALPDEIQDALDSVLQARKASKGVITVDDLRTVAEAFPTSSYRARDRTAVWRGDITRLQVDAVVNAANARLLGCYIPFHPCIDNALHRAAGPRMRSDCATIIDIQGHEEPTGSAKATRAYNLPASYVLHTVGPIVSGAPSASDREALSSSYRACLDTASELGLRTLAFCSISTGVFGYPKGPASSVALGTVASWLDEHSDSVDLVVFDVFSDEDEDAYGRRLSEAGGTAAGT